jgi:hypothetical protein
VVAFLESKLKDLAGEGFLQELQSITKLDAGDLLKSLNAPAPPVISLPAGATSLAQAVCQQAKTQLLAVPGVRKHNLWQIDCHVVQLEYHAFQKCFALMIFACVVHCWVYHSCQGGSACCLIRQTAYQGMAVNISNQLGLTIILFLALHCGLCTACRVTWP